MIWQRRSVQTRRALRPNKWSRIPQLEAHSKTKSQITNWNKHQLLITFPPVITTCSNQNQLGYKFQVWYIHSCCCQDRYSTRSSPGILEVSAYRSQTRLFSMNFQPRLCNLTLFFKLPPRDVTTVRLALLSERALSQIQEYWGCSYSFWDVLFQGVSLQHFFKVSPITVSAGVCLWDVWLTMCKIFTLCSGKKCKVVSLQACTFPPFFLPSI